MAALYAVLACNSVNTPRPEYPVAMADLVESEIESDPNMSESNSQ